jgi:hypothetical protein
LIVHVELAVCIVIPFLAFVCHRSLSRSSIWIVTDKFVYDTFLTHKALSVKQIKPYTSDNGI